MNSSIYKFFEINLTGDVIGDRVQQHHRSRSVTNKYAQDTWFLIGFNLTESFKFKPLNHVSYS